MTKILTHFFAITCLFIAVADETVAATPDSIGPLPKGTSSVITALHITNDRANVRTDELAFSSIPIARSMNLLSTDELVIAGPGEVRLQAQFNVLARWGSVATDVSAPIKWLEVSVKGSVPAMSSINYSLRRIIGATPASDSQDVMISQNGPRYTISTGVATFEIDPTLAALFISMRVGGQEVYNPAATIAGPQVIDRTGKRLNASVDTGGFEIEQAGPVKLIVKSSGHFKRTTTGSVCDSDLAYTARLTFVRGSANVGMEFDLRNECGSGQKKVGPDIGNGNFWGEFYEINEASWDFPLQLGASTSAIATEDGVSRPAAAFAGTARIEQEYGSTSNVNWRRARAGFGSTIVHEKSAFERPMLTVIGSTASAAIAMPWMRFREPQALAAEGTALSIKFVSSNIAIGEAMTRWNYASLRFFAAGATDEIIAAERDTVINELERGLLVAAPVDYLNTTSVKSRLPELASGTRLNRYLQTINKLHQSTMEQWQPTKKYGLSWPDTIDRSQYNLESKSAETSIVGSNYWSASRSEFAEFYRSGDPKWFWDFSFALEQTFLKTIVYNTGSRVVPSDTRSGFHPGGYSSSNQQTGRAFREGYESVDYLYNQGSDEAYLIRPSGALRDIFAKACQTFINIYPTESELPEASRDFWLNTRRITRGTVQQFNMMKYAVEFVQDPVLNVQCEQRLKDVMTELVRDNIFAGIACTDDSGNQEQCKTQQNFMYSALTHNFFDMYLRHYGDTETGGALTRMLSGMADLYIDTMMPKNADGSINVAGNWGKVLSCSFNGNMITSCESVPTNEPSYKAVRPNHLSVLLMSNAWDQTPGRCEKTATALSSVILGGYYDARTVTPSVGWWKGASQAMQNVVFGIGEAELCDADGGKNVDTDNDGVVDSQDAFPLDPAESVDSDNDGIGNNADTDDDNDGVADSADAFPLDANESVDSDGDGIGNNADTDDDNDGVADSADAFPLDTAESVDSDGDGIGNNADTDDDNDGIPDTEDAFPLDATNNEGNGPIFGDIAPLTVEATGITTPVSLEIPQVSDTDISAVTVISDYNGPLTLGSHEITWTATDQAGNMATAIQLVHIVDTTLPVFSKLAVQTIDARGMLTNIASDIEIYATDSVDGDILAVVVGDALYHSGQHTVQVSAYDSTGNQSHSELVVKINPLIELAQHGKAEAGATYKFPVTLSGPAAIYPVTVNYQLAGSIASSVTNKLVFEDGVEQYLELTISDEAITGDEATITMLTATNAVIPDNSQLTLTVTETNQSPIVAIVVEQGGAPVSVITPQADLVTITAVISDLNQGDKHTVNWNVGDSPFIDSDVDGISTTFELEPDALSAGTYGLTVEVTESNTSEMFGVAVDIKLIVESRLAALSPDMDSDGDGIQDAQEGYGDNDQDGIADYLDNDSNTSRLPSGEGTAPLQTIDGLKLSLGDIVRSAGGAASNSASIKVDDIARYGSDNGTSVDNSADHQFTALSAITNFNISGLAVPGDTVPVVLPLAAGNKIPAGAIYRKYNETIGWFDFVVDDKNSLSSAVKDSDGNCPVPLSNSYALGLNVGADCIQLLIEDGGQNDGDGIANGMVKDPGVMVTNLEAPNTGESKESGSGGGFISWLLLLSCLGLVSRKVSLKRAT